MFSRPHWSFSAINQYLRCPLRFYFQRVLKLPKGPTSSNLVLGSAVHAALAKYHQSIQGEHPASPDHIRKTFLDSWVSREQGEEIEFSKGATRENCIAQGLSLMDVYLKAPPPTGIVEVERKVIVPIQNSAGEYLETPLVAVADLVTRTEDDLQINEFKTAGRSYRKFEIETSLQATCYVNAAVQLYDEMEDVQFIVLVKTKTPKVQRLTTTRTETDFGRLGDHVQTLDRAVKAEVFYPVESPLNCSNCPFRQPCREWGTTSMKTAVPKADIDERCEVAACCRKCPAKEGVSVSLRKKENYDVR